MKHLKEIAIEQIAPQLRALRVEQRLRIEDIARQTGLPTGIIDTIELGYGLSFDRYQRLIRFYGKKLKISLE